MLITSSSSAHQRRAFREACRCEESHPAGVHGLPPPPRFIYLSRLINPYSVPHLRRVAYDQREVAWLVVTRPSTSSILRWKSPRSPSGWSAFTRCSPRTPRALSQTSRTGASVPLPTRSKRKTRERLPQCATFVRE